MQAYVGVHEVEYFAGGVRGSVVHLGGAAGLGCGQHGGPGLASYFGGAVGAVGIHYQHFGLRGVAPQLGHEPANISSLVIGRNDNAEIHTEKTDTQIPCF